MKHNFFFILFTLFSIVSVAVPAAPIHAADVTITATVDRSEASLDDYIMLQLSIEGTRDEPELPDMSAFRIQSRGSSSQVSIINGRMSSRIEYTYMLYPQKTGIFTIGPFTITEKGETFKSNQITLTITKAQQQQEKDTGEIFITAQVDNENPYLNEQIVCTFLFCRRVKVANANLSEQPSFEGFITEDLGKPREYQKVINGQQYVVTEVKKALFPVKTGVLEISPYTLQCDAVVQRSRGRGGFRDPFFDDSFFGFTETVPKTFRTSPVTVMVKPLPAEGKPSDFKNLVGSFTLSSELSKKNMQVGESATLTFTLTGTGNLKSLSSVEIQGLDNFKVYDDKPVFEQSVSGGKVGGKLVIKKALVPLHEGSLTIPQVAVAYFDPASGSYKKAAGSSYVLAVSPSQNRENMNVVSSPALSESAKREIKVLGQDIMPIHTTHEALAGAPTSPLSLLNIVLFILPIGVFILVFSFRKNREKASADTGAVRARKAYATFTRELASAKKLIHRDDAAFYQAAAKALKDFIGGKLNIAGGALTARELPQVLADAQVPAEACSEAARLLDIFDSAQFGFKKCSAQEKDAAWKALKQVARTLDKKIKMRKA